jgi:uncharacterized membrane protein
MGALSAWQFRAVLSALLAALTAIFAKVGGEQIGADLATFIRTLIVVAFFGMIFLGEMIAAPNGLGVAMIAAGAMLVAF